jgi:hypothetical protein
MATLTPTFGSIIPSQVKTPTGSNYLTFDSATGGGTFAEQYLPELYEQEVERYGNRTLSGFLRMVGAEMPMTSDQVIWSEQNRLHISYNNVAKALEATDTLTFTTNQLTGAAAIRNVISKGQTVVILDPSGAEAKAVVTASTDSGTEGALTLALYTGGSATLSTIFGDPEVTDLKVFVYGSEFGKGSGTGGATVPQAYDMTSVDPSFTQYSNSPIIIRDFYQVNGSDMAQIGWVEVATEDGTSGYLWYLKAESETRLRFEDYLEMAVVEGELADPTSQAAAALYKGTQGLFAAIEERGNKSVGFSAATGLADFDNILKNLDTQGAIEENMLFLNRSTSLDFDDMLAGVGSPTSGIYQGGSSYGVFENSSEMALNLGFTGFRRGSYDFYKTDWKYLNDASTRGGMTGTASIEGVLVPAGTSTVYDQILGTNIRRPFLHTRYRASQGDDRRMKQWVTGSAGGAYTSDLDAMQLHFLSERCLCVQAANNFVIFKGV